MVSALQVSEARIEGFLQPIALRIYEPSRQSSQQRSHLAVGRLAVELRPIVLYFHGGGFVGGSLDQAQVAASFIATHAGAMVISVAYSLAPAYPFPAAPEDGYRAAKWAVGQAGSRASKPRLGVAGHDAGGNLATCVAAMARDRGEVVISAQALLAPLLDPSMTRVGDGALITSDVKLNECAQCYRAYLPNASQRLHPYAAPLESSRLAGLPPALIASAQNDVLHVEAERYASALIAAGVPTQVTRHRNASHAGLAADVAALAEVALFLRQRLAATQPLAVTEFDTPEF
ncbi:MAG: alpha/beta hydrolase [Janthinobacterium lividum]